MNRPLLTINVLQRDKDKAGDFALCEGMSAEDAAYCLAIAMCTVIRVVSEMDAQMKDHGSFAALFGKMMEAVKQGEIESGELLTFPMKEKQP